MTEETKTNARKRRTRAEMKLWLQEELKRVEAEEKAEVVKLLSDAHDTLERALNLPAAGPIKGALTPTMGALKAQIAVASK